VPDFSLTGEHLIMGEPIFSDLGVKYLGMYNPPIIDLSMPIIIQVQPYERQVVSQATMETNVATSSGSTYISSTVFTTGGSSLRNQPWSVQATMASIVATLGNGLILSMMMMTNPLT
jgi:hypothetical protein